MQCGTRPRARCDVKLGRGNHAPTWGPGMVRARRRASSASRTGQGQIGQTRALELDPHNSYFRFRSRAASRWLGPTAFGNVRLAGFAPDLDLSGRCVAALRGVTSRRNFGGYAGDVAAGACVPELHIIYYVTYRCLRLLESDCTRLCKNTHCCEVRTPSVRKREM